MQNKKIRVLVYTETGKIEKYVDALELVALSSKYKYEYLH